MVNRVAMIFSYVMLDIRSISFRKHKNIIKFLDDLKFLSEAICWSHCKPSTYATCYLIELCQIVMTLSEIHFILPWSRTRTSFHHMLCFYTKNKHSMLMYETYLWKLHQGYGAIQKETEIKDAYPKKVCPMPRHVKKKERKEAYPKKVCHMLRHVKKREK